MTQSSLDVFYGDNPEALRSMEAASADLISVDPPFDTGKRPFYCPPAEGERTQSMFPAMSESPPCDWI
jgi:hypothetical protein